MVFWNMTPLAWKLRVEGCGCSLTWSTIQVFTWRDWEKPRKPSVKIVGVPAEIRIGHVPHWSHELCRLSQLARWHYYLVLCKAAVWNKVLSDEQPSTTYVLCIRFCCLPCSRSGSAYCDMSAVFPPNRFPFHLHLTAQAIGSPWECVSGQNGPSDRVHPWFLPPMFREFCLGSGLSFPS
jgi:hypothetical protein